MTEGEEVRAAVHRFPVLAGAGPVVLLLLLGTLVPAGQATADEPEWSPADLEFFERAVRPVLARRCSSCHSEANAMAGLQLDSRERVLQGGHRGPAAVAGDPDASLLVSAVRHESLRMPLGDRLPDPEVAALEEWVRRGLPWPEALPEAVAGDVASQYESMRREHWAFQPVSGRQPPPAGSGPWSVHPIDRFVGQALGQASLEPNLAAEPAILLRRLNYVLTGLPPTPREVAEYARDPSDAAYERAVDRLLASDHFGERWARHWMDVVRFGETLGNDWNYENNGAWLYRDYLIRAFNADVPYDQLVREHLAGDLLEHPRMSPDGSTNESLIGTFFYRLGEQGHDDCTTFREVRTDVVDDQIDTLGKAFQGLTVACARCHDHKLDPIPTADYYGLYGVLDSSRMVTRTVDTGRADQQVEGQLRTLKPAIRREIGDVWLSEARELEALLLASLEAGDGEAPSGSGAPVLDPERVETLRSEVEMEELPLAHPLSPWRHLVAARSTDSPGTLGEAWTHLAERYGRSQRRRDEFNGESFERSADFASGALQGWHAEGRGLSPAPAAPGGFAIAPEGQGAVAGVYPAGLYTHLVSEKLNGALRSPHFPRDRRYLSLRLVGGKLAAWRTVLDNCMLSEHYSLLDQPRPGWVRIPLRSEHGEYRIFAELVTKHDNPRLPDRPARSSEEMEAGMADPRSWFGVSQAVLHDCEELPEDSLTHVLRLFGEAAPRDRNGVAARYAAVAAGAVAAWRDGRATDEDVRWIDWLLASGLVTNSKYATPRLRGLVDRYRTLERRLRQPRVVQGMADLEAGHDTPVFRFGDPSDPGEVVPRRFLSLLEGSAREQPAGSGRREVAEMIASRSNPLTARVMVNRVWHHMFGRGLVPTVDNLGRFGERPSHPELLDHLAMGFMDGGWSVKELIRDIALSQAFRQSSVGRTAARTKDPANELYHRYPGRRLDAESVRDTILAVSGKLERTLFGPSIQPYREKPKPYRKLNSGPLDGEGRRSIYLKVTRHEGSAFLEAFDFPVPSVARGRRDVTNVPSQALALLNDPFVTAEAEHWSAALVEETSESVRSRLRTMYNSALNRYPTAEEQESMEGLAERFADLHGVPTENILNSVPVWRDMAHTIFNLREFVYIR